MSSKHETIVNQIIQDWSKSGRGRLFKNNVGTAWWGKTSNTDKQGAILIEFAKKITYGLPVGSSDLIGWQMCEYELNIPVMPMEKFIVPIICSIEVKTKAYPTLSKEQILWLNNIVNIGGRAYVARETDDGYDLREWEVV